MNNYEMMAKATIEAGKAVDAIKPGDIIVCTGRDWGEGQQLYFYINISRGTYCGVSKDTSKHVYLPISWLSETLASGRMKIISV